jgi:hypothetical protein
MAQLLFTVASMTSPDIYKDVGLHKRGDVIAVMPDKHVWSAKELSNPDWRIVHIPGVPVAVFEDLLMQETPNGPGTLHLTRQLRGRRLDVSDISIPAGVRDWLTDDTRAEPVRTIAARAIIDAINKAVDPVPDPAELGGSAHVIG